MDGLSNGAIWALIALGYTLVYGIIELINFAHGEVFMIGSFVAVGCAGRSGSRRHDHALPPSACCSPRVAMVVCGLLNVMIERVGLPAAARAPSSRR